METGTLREILESSHRVGLSGRIEINSESSGLKVWLVRGEIAHARSEAGLIGWQAIESVASRRVIRHFVVADELPPARTVRLETGGLLKALRHFESVSSAPEPYAPVPLHVRLEERYAHLRSRMTGLVCFEAHVKSASAGTDPQAVQAAHDEEGSADGDRVIIEQTPRQSRWEFRHRDRRLVLIGEAGLMTGDLLWAGEQLRKELLQIEQEEGKPNE